MSTKEKDVLKEYEEMAKNPESHSLFDLVNLLQRVKKETDKLDSEEREQRAVMAKKTDGTPFQFLDNRLKRKLDLKSAEKKLERIIAEIENERE